MKVLFASGDVGGARALLPVIKLCENRGFSFAVIKHGHIINECQKHWQKIPLDENLNQHVVSNFYKRNNINTLVFASSVEDTTALSLARLSKTIGISVIHVLDNWSSYLRRMETDGLSVFVPDVYAVMDDIAFKEAIKDGVDRSVLQITGQPALASLAKEYKLRKNMNVLNERKRLGFGSKKIMVIFISEPAERDQGASSASPQYRGYTEKTVLKKFCNELQQYANDIEVGILPHPRENINGLLETWNRYKGNVHGGPIYLDFGRESIFYADGVVGMASILLYEAWLLGKPVISLQPGLKTESLRILKKRNGLIFVDSQKNIDSSISTWISIIQQRKKTVFRPELQIHEKAPDKIFSLIEKYANSNQVNHQLY